MERPIYKRQDLSAERMRMNWKQAYRGDSQLCIEKIRLTLGSNEYLRYKG